MMPESRGKEASPRKAEQRLPHFAPELEARQAIQQRPLSGLSARLTSPKQGFLTSGSSKLTK